MSAYLITNRIVYFFFVFVHAEKILRMTLTYCHKWIMISMFQYGRLLISIRLNV